jgi:hypothetical protein
MDTFFKFLKWFPRTLWFACIASLLGPSSQGLQGSPAIAFGLGYEGAYVDRGLKVSDAVLYPTLDVAFEHFYLGAEAFLEFEEDYDEVDLYLGTYQSLSPLFSLDLGINFIRADQVDDQELYVGLVLEYLLNPAIYAYYEVELEQFTLDVSIGSKYELNGNWTLAWTIRGGGVWPDAPGESSWLFLDGSADLIYPLSQTVSLSFGLRASTRDDDLGLPDQSILWGGAGLSIEL